MHITLQKKHQTPHVKHTVDKQCNKQQTTSHQHTATVRSYMVQSNRKRKNMYKCKIFFQQLYD